MTPLASIASAVLSVTPWRLERRLEVDAKRAALTRIGGAVGAMVVVGILLLLTGRNAFLIFWQALDAIFGRQRGIEGVALRAIPILMTALGVALSLRMKVWNIGSDGQFLMGALAAVGVGIHMDGPGWLVLILMAAAATLAGAAWILVPALARAYWDVNEIITTLLLNFVALQLVTWSALGFWRDKAAAVIQSTREVPFTLPGIPGANSVTIALLVPLAIAAVLWWVFRSTSIGYEIDIIGGNPRAAGFAGIAVRRRILIVMLFTGAIAGLGGMLQLSAPGAQAMNAGFSAQFGLSGFIVAALAGAAFWGVIGGGLFIASMFYAGIVLQTKGLSVYIIFAIYGVILTGIALGEIAARYRVVRRDAADESGATAGESAAAPQGAGS
ncbi:MAG: ABC transporter permease [Acidimicrobiaceae bacterium]|nr:ABC transporter permease [Acidimicrobiaceae bacterium]MDE0515439.1 ABC transporter permease [Acidimicrobiaceae bacterium]MDE0657816.1 ABC transporter permease [Acidimicrobiaceae bacterium]MXZ94894.1 ABC transporter permease [Acidimicrobiaceae bacterium]MYF42280.1 ABC transporter permease [Acidimicrobiaceae bacterium]